MGQAQDALEARMEEERKSAMEVKILFRYYLLFKWSIDKSGKLDFFGRGEEKSLCLIQS